MKRRNFLCKKSFFKSSCTMISLLFKNKQNFVFNKSQGVLCSFDLNDRNSKKMKHTFPPISFPFISYCRPQFSIIAHNFNNIWSIFENFDASKIDIIDLLITQNWREKKYEFRSRKKKNNKHNKIIFM